jgi:ABC-type nitrate/sulfonate/bicarbonate transport system permease component
MAERRRRDEDDPPVQLRPIRFRGGGFAVRPPRLAAIIAFVVAIAAWEAASRQGWLNPAYLPAPSAVLAALRDLAVQDALWRHIGASLQRLLIGWSLGTVAGLIVGLAIGLWTVARALGLPLVSALYPIPQIAVLPLLVYWFDPGDLAIVATVALGAFLPTANAVHDGMDGVPRNLIRMGQSFGMPRRAILWNIVLPGAQPAILSGVRTSAAIALILLIAAEMVSTDRGVGSFIQAAGDRLMIDQLLAGLVVLAILGIAIGLLLSMLESWLLRWR